MWKTGYELLLHQGYPLPSLSTLKRHLSSFLFNPGILVEVFQLLKLKAEAMDPHDKLCVLTLDEVALKASTDYDIKNDELLGQVTLPKHEGDATKALVYMLGGVASRWKQTVAYHYTSNSIDGTVMGEIAIEVIRAAEGIGLKVMCVTSDMASSNQAMWK